MIFKIYLGNYKTKHNMHKQVHEAVHITQNSELRKHIYSTLFISLQVITSYV